MGIAPEMLPRIFELFTQADAASTGRRAGWASASRWCAACVELHGGRCRRTSAGPGRGSDLHGAAAAAAAPQVQPTPPPTARRRAPGRRRRRHVLLVEDSDDNREMLQDAAGEVGHRVDVAARRASRRRARRWRCGPRSRSSTSVCRCMDGFEVARRLRAALGRERLLVALTGYGQAGGSAPRARRPASTRT